jgi:outer membrane protein insertion porin family
LGLVAALTAWTVGGVVYAQADSDVISQIRVEGNQRIEPETVRSYMQIAVGQPYDAEKVDQSLKTLFATGLFADVTIRREGTVLIVSVVENPIINRIAFEGNKAIKKDKLDKEVQLRPRVVYTRARVRADVQRIIEIYRRSGRFAATVEPKIVQLPQNRVDLIFEIHEGKKTKIRRITFIGNEHYSDGELRSRVSTKESRWWRIFSKGDTYDPDRLAYDRELLRQFYLQHGYADFRVVSAVAELTKDRREFFITFTVEEGQTYRFGKIDIVSDIRDLKPEALSDLIQPREGKIYNAKQIEDTVDALSEAAGVRGYAFVDIRPEIKRDKEKRIIDVTFHVLQAPRVYVERIDITGNFRTLDRVIRREMRLAEGDAFNVAMMRRSRERIRGLGFFGDVTVDQVQGSAPDRNVIQVSVQEQSTGELQIGAGYSSQESLIGQVSIRERNLLGRGQDLRFSFQISSIQRTFDLGFTEPYFMGRDVAAGIDLFSSSTDYTDYSYYKQGRTGFQLRTAFPVTEYLTVGLRYKFSQDNITLGTLFDPSSFPPYIRDSLGKFTTSSIGYSISYDRRDDRLDPKRGFFWVLSQDLAGLGGSVKYIRSDMSFAWYHPLFKDNWVLSFTLQEGYIKGLGQGVRINDRYFLGGQDLRGFEPYGVGPASYDANAQKHYDALGGNLRSAGSLEFTVPVGATSELGLKFSTFVDFGTLAYVDFTGPGVFDVGSLRASAGVGVGWKSPMGPIRLDFAVPLRKEPFDRTQLFQFNFGTRF